MARKLASDKVLFGALVALSLFGCIMIYSASAVSSGETSGNPYRFLLKQIGALALGGLAAFAVYRTDYRRFARPWVVYGVYAATLLLAVFALFQSADQRRAPLDPARASRCSSPRSSSRSRSCWSLAYQLSRKAQTAGDPETGARAGARLLGRGGGRRRPPAGPRHGGVLRHALRRAAVAGRAFGRAGSPSARWRCSRCSRS